MEPDVLHTIFSQLSKITYITQVIFFVARSVVSVDNVHIHWQEVSDGGASTPSQYVGNGLVHTVGLLHHTSLHPHDRDVIEFGATANTMAAFLGTGGASVIFPRFDFVRIIFIY